MVHFEMSGNKVYKLEGRDGNGIIDHCYNNEACACRLNQLVLGTKAYRGRIYITGINTGTLHRLQKE